VTTNARAPLADDAERERRRLLRLSIAALGVATLVKIAQGGWFPLAVAAGVYVLMTTWKRGRELLGERLRTASPPLDRILADIKAGRTLRVPGTAVFLTGNLQNTPLALMQNLKHNKVIHEQVVLLTIVTEEVPHVAPEERLEVDSLGQGFYRLTAWYGFMEEPQIPRLMKRARELGLVCDPEETTYFLGRETLLATERPGMAIWREKLFGFMSRNQQRAAAFFQIPPERAMEVGALIEI
jgi:KUP system potassium uptake protein